MQVNYIKVSLSFCFIIQLQKVLDFCWFLRDFWRFHRQQKQFSVLTNLEIPGLVISMDFYLSQGLKQQPSSTRSSVDDV